MLVIIDPNVLQIAGWLLTVVGQVQIALKARAGFVTWTAANAVLVVLCVHANLWWSIGMHGTNTLVCLWSYRKWGRGPIRRLSREILAGTLPALSTAHPLGVRHRATNEHSDRTRRDARSSFIAPGRTR